jgi:hypothetical protein
MGVEYKGFVSVGEKTGVILHIQFFPMREFANHLQ